MKHFVVALFAFGLAAPAFADSSVADTPALPPPAEAPAAAVSSLSAPQDGEPTAVTYLPPLPPPVRACVQACFKNGTPGAASDCSELPELKRRIKRLAGKYEQLKKSVERLDGRLTEAAERLDGKDAELAKELASQKEALARLETRLRETDALILVLTQEDGEHKARLNNLDTDVGKLSSRVEALEKRLSPIKVGPRVGVLVLQSRDGTSYSGGFAGAGLTLLPSEKLAVRFDGGGLVTGGGSNHFGLAGRAGVSYEITQTFRLDVGASTAWVGYDNSMKAKSAFVLADIGTSAKIYGRVFVAGSALIGAEFDHDGPSFVYGGLTTIGLEFP